MMNFYAGKLNVGNIDRVYYLIKLHEENKLTISNTI